MNGLSKQIAAINLSLHSHGHLRNNCLTGEALARYNILLLHVTLASSTYNDMTPGTQDFSCNQTLALYHKNS